MSNQPSHLPAIGYYVHHHGAGHIMRAISIAATLENFSVFFLGSNLEPYQHLIPKHIECIHLPMDVATEGETLSEEQELSFLHYAPLGVNGVRLRVAIMTAFFKENFPLLLIVDVSVEVTMLARLCGIPTVVVRQHGNRTDRAHLNAYQSAEFLLAPYPEELAVAEEEDWIVHKTFYPGGFSRYTNVACDSQEVATNVGILLGEGGTSIDEQLIELLQSTCRTYTFHIIGSLAGKTTRNQPNVIWHGKLNDPVEILLQCAVVIGNAGHNTVMEMADLNKRFICIPEKRPFDEQERKAELLQIRCYAKVVQPEVLLLIDWLALLDRLVNEQADWRGITNPKSLEKIGRKIEGCFADLYGSEWLIPSLTAGN